jgi:hypothetical protein
MSAEPVMSSGDLELMVHATCVKGVDKSGPAFATTAPLQERYIDFQILIEPPPLPTATITDLCNEPLFAGYMSSEEEMSSSDNSSLSSINSSTIADDFGDDFFETNFPEMLAEDCTFVEQAQCDKAEVITLISPGKAKVVRVSRVDLSSSSSPIIKRATCSVGGEKQPRNSRRLSIVSLRAHSHTAAVASPKVVSPKMPSTPELEIGSPNTSVSSHDPATPGSPASAYFDAPTFMTTPCPKNRMSRNGYHLEPPRAVKRPGSAQSMQVPLSAPLAAPSFFGFTKPKMMPRGASERMASFELPPYTRESFQAPPKNRWTLRKDSVNSVSSNETPRFSLRRAESGLLPSWR